MRMGILLRRAFILPICSEGVNMRVNQPVRAGMRLDWLVDSHIVDIITNF